VTTALLIVLGVLGVALLAFQVYVLRWQERLPGGAPTSLRVIRGVNLGLLIVALALAAWLVIRVVM
jgi:hypothetical protein